MKLKLNVVNSQGSTWEDVTEHGTLAQSLENTDRVQFSNKNLLSDKRVVIFIHEKSGGAPKMVACSSALSNVVRKALASKSKREVMSVLINLRVVENENGFFLTPDGNPAELFTVKELKSETVTYDELVAF